MINDAWLLTYPDAITQFLPEGLYDHCPCVIHWAVDAPKYKKSFKYYNTWSLAPEFSDIIQHGWNYDMEGTLMYKVVQKLKQLKKPPRQLN